MFVSGLTGTMRPANRLTGNSELFKIWYSLIACNNPYFSLFQFMKFISYELSSSPLVSMFTIRFLAYNFIFVGHTVYLFCN